jgi:hypothetical protein
MTMVNTGGRQMLRHHFNFHTLNWLPFDSMVSDGAVQALRYRWDVGLLDWVPVTV